ncbi:hypothetical protein PIB30_044957 [Stylosanthes scabra]|uniref:Ribonuclease H1 N-terminal domain-containing protein n=1 Tax=Stylosanthes scabra TaxID=79078 RepID=A0ABU6TGA2_9FABA|nr:hypothetical protein [Stylosanthes scabra]
MPWNHTIAPAHCNQRDSDFMGFLVFSATHEGHYVGVYDSFEEASRQVIAFSNAEYQGFNSRLLVEGAFSAKLEAIQDEKKSLEEMHALFNDHQPSPPPSPPYVPTSHGRVAPLRGGVNLVPADEIASFPYTLSVSPENWLSKVCYDASIPAPAYFRSKVALASGGVCYCFSVVIPGNPLC